MKLQYALTIDTKDIALEEAHRRLACEFEDCIGKHVNDANQIAGMEWVYDSVRVKPIKLDL